MKKTGKFLLALGLFLSTGLVVSARENVQYPDDSTNVRVTGTIGEFDSTDPDQPEPPVTEWWLDVSLETNVTFFSDQSNVNTLTSNESYIHNYSGRGVDVFVRNFTHDATTGAYGMIGQLQIESDGTAIGLINGGTITPRPAQVLLVEINRLSNAYFEFSGNLSTVPTATTRPAFNLVLGFEVNLNN